MRNLKKVLSLVLCMAMMLSIMVMGTSAAFADQEDIDSIHTEAVDVCVALNIIGGYPDGTYNPDGNVTRAEMCKMICIALNGGKEPVLGESNAPSFSDINGNWAEAYVESCVSKGIVAGMGDGTFNPNGQVTGTQAAKMLLIALGYDADHQKYLGEAWAINVNTDASAKGLYADLEDIDANAALTREHAAEMIYNTLNAYEVEYTTTLVADENGQLTTKVTCTDKVVGDNRDKITLMEDKYEAETLVGTFNGNYDTGYTGKEGQIDVGGYDFYYDFDLGYVGEEVKVIFKESADGVPGLDSKDTIYGVYLTGETTVYNIIKDDIQSVSATEIKFNDVKHDYVTGTVDFNFGVNSAVLNKTTLDALAVASGDTIKFVTNDDGDIYRAYVVESNITNVAAVSATKVSLPNVGAIDIEGNDIYEGIAKDDVVVVTQFYDANKDDATFVITPAETVEGVVDSYYNPEKVTVDGTTYYLDATELVGGNMPNLTDNTIAAFANANLTEDAVLYLINGFVGAADSTAADTIYALVTDVHNLAGYQNAINGAKIQLLTLDGKTIYNIDEDSDQNITVANLAKGKIVEFSMVSEDTVEIESIVTDKAQVANNGVIYDKDSKSLTIDTDNDGDGNDNAPMVVASDAVFFTDVDNTTATDYKAYTLRSLNDIINKTGSAVDVYYVLNADGDQVVAAFADLGSKPSGAASNTMYGMVTAVEQNVKVDNAYYNKYVVWTGEETTIYTKDTFNKGDYVTFDKTSDDLYASGDVKDVVPTVGGVGTVIWVVEYDEEDQILTYEDISNVQHTVAIDEDVKIVYVDRANEEAGDEIGVNHYDRVTGYANAIILDNEPDGKYDAIIVDDNYDVTDVEGTSAAIANAIATSVMATTQQSSAMGSFTPSAGVTVGTPVATGDDSFTIPLSGSYTKGSGVAPGFVSPDTLDKGFVVGIKLPRPDAAVDSFTFTTNTGASGTDSDLAAQSGNAIVFLFVEQNEKLTLTCQWEASGADYGDPFTILVDGSAVTFS